MAPQLMAVLGRVLIRQTKVNLFIHRLAHWRVPKDQACFVCAAVWTYFVSLPGVPESIAQGQADIAEGRGVLYEVVDGELVKVDR